MYSNEVELGRHTSKPEVYVKEETAKLLPAINFVSLDQTFMG
jgi:hypothetical protein